MLVLAIDTSTPAVTAGVVSLSASSPDPVSPDTESPDTVETLAVRVTVNPRAHAEVLTPHVLECLAEAGLTPADLNAVVVGVGPGPYTGLRVGMATGAAFGDALGVPVYGVCSLDAIAAAVPTTPSLLVVTDARRREIYWARYDGGVRVEGPAVNSMRRRRSFAFDADCRIRFARGLLRSTRRPGGDTFTGRVGDSRCSRDPVRLGSGPAGAAVPPTPGREDPCRTWQVRQSR